LRDEPCLAKHHAFPEKPWLSYHKKSFKAPLIPYSVVISGKLLDITTRLSGTPQSSYVRFYMRAHGIIMSKIFHGQFKAPSVEKKSLRQKRDWRKLSLEKKSHEYSKLCGADVCLGIRIRESGKVFIFSADTSGFWSFLTAQLVCLRSCVDYDHILKLTPLGFALSPTDSENRKQPRLKELQKGLCT
jgi:hypothetical protein